MLYLLLLDYSLTFFLLSFFPCPTTSLYLSRTCVSLFILLLLLLLLLLLCLLLLCWDTRPPLNNPRGTPKGSDALLVLIFSGQIVCAWCLCRVVDVCVRVFTVPSYLFFLPSVSSFPFPLPYFTFSSHSPLASILSPYFSLLPLLF
jgi:hypothetical protein